MRSAFAPLSFGVSALTATASVRTAQIGWLLATVGAAELSDGKCDCAEEGARIIVIRRGKAFLVGDAVIRRLNEELGGPLHPYHREDAERHIKVCPLSALNELAVQSVGQSCGKLNAVPRTAGTTAIAGAFDLRAEDHGLDRLYIGDRVIVPHGVKASHIAIIVFGRGGKGDRSAVSAVEDDILLCNGDTAEVLTFSNAEARLAFNENVVAHGDLIKAAIEGHLIDTDIRPQERCASRAHIGCVCERFLAEGGQIDTRILKAISVAAAVKNAIGVNTYRAFPVTAETVCHISVFRHIVLPVARGLA